MNALGEGLSVFMDHWRLTMGMLGFAALSALPFFLRLPSDLSNASTRSPKSVSASTGFFLVLFLCLTLLLRLAFVARVVLPSYFDSAQHYALIARILADDFSQTFEMLRADFYHMGFHFLAAFLVSIFREGIAITMLIAGQVILVLLPLPLFFIVKQTTGSTPAAWCSAALSAFGWYMPAHAVNWGKYPALLGILLILYTLEVVVLFYGKPLSGRMRWIPVLAGFGVLASILAHSRALVVFGMLLLSWGAATRWSGLRLWLRNLVLLMALAGLVFEVTVVLRREVLSLLLDPYLGEGVWTTLLVALSAVFAHKLYPRFTFAALLFVNLLFAGLFVPVQGVLLSRPYLTLLDRPFVEMFLFLPLSLLGGVGVAGLERTRLGRFAALLAAGFVVTQAVLGYKPYPSDCCVIAGSDDVLAIAWAAKQLPAEARVGIASMQLKVLPDATFEGEVGADAGLWIAPLAGRGTVLLPFDVDFSQPASLDLLCRARVSHLFVGEKGQTFDRASLDLRPAWYRPLLSMPKTAVYEVTGCD
ncbi:MAG: hypothetical protein HXY42_05835 [Chloroflexi bacterium]|nr:hypothetical protein [Chloroflexota bacterium]